MCSHRSAVSTTRRPSGSSVAANTQQLCPPLLTLAIRPSGRVHEHVVQPGHLAAAFDLRYQFDIMRAVPNVHIRDVPPETLESLREAARSHGRSLNAEIVDVLVSHADRERRDGSIAERLHELHRRWERWYPEGYPPGLEPETIIRRHRDGG